MNQQEKEGISFCIPVHNAGGYVEETISTILAQDLADFEIICVEDGSDDDSWEVLRHLSEQHDVIRLYRNETGRGVCFTRNRMIDLAQKKYIWFVDADDLLVPGSAGRLLAQAEERSADVLFGRVRSFEDEKKPDMDETAQWGTGEIVEADPAVPWTFFGRDQYEIRSCGIWLGLFRKAFLDDNHMRFHQELVRGEDYTFIYEISMLPEKRVITSDLYSYCYRLKPFNRTPEEEKSFQKLCVENDIKSLEILRANPNADRPENRLIVRDFTVGAVQDILLCLQWITDIGFVRYTLRYLKSGGYYPFKYVTNTRNIIMKKKYQYLAYEPVFWLYYTKRLILNRYYNWKTAKRAADE